MNKHDARQLAQIITEKHQAETILTAIAFYSATPNRKTNFKNEAELLDYISILTADYLPEEQTNA